MTPCHISDATGIAQFRIRDDSDGAPIAHGDAMSLGKRR
jgi:hypothetical protein